MSIMDKQYIKMLLDASKDRIDIAMGLLHDIEHDDEIDACLRSAKADLVVVKMLLKDK